MDKPIPAYIQLQYLSRIKTAVKMRDAEMLAALYAQCEQLNIAVPHYELPKSSILTPIERMRAKEYESELPAIEITEFGKVTIRQNNMLEFNGESRSVKEWCKFYGINRLTFRTRLQHGWTIEDALTRIATRNT